MLNCFLIDPLHSPEDGFPALGRHCLLRPHRVRRGLIPPGGGRGGARRGGPGRACSHARPRVASAPRAADAVCAPTRAGFALRPFTRGGGTGAINACCSLGKGPFGGWGGVGWQRLPCPGRRRRGRIRGGRRAQPRVLPHPEAQERGRGGRCPRLPARRLPPSPSSLSAVCVQTLTIFRSVFPGGDTQKSTKPQRSALAPPAFHEAALLC